MRVLWVGPPQERGLCAANEHPKAVGRQRLSWLIQGQRASTGNTCVSHTMQTTPINQDLRQPRQSVWPWLCTLTSFFGLQQSASKILHAVLSKTEEEMAAPSASCPLVSFFTCHKQSGWYSAEVRSEDASRPVVLIVQEQSTLALPHLGWTWSLFPDPLHLVRGTLMA